MLPLDQSLNGTVLLTPACGAWCNNFSGARDLVASSWALFDHTVVLPGTFELGGIEPAGKEVSYFRRDNSLSQAGIPESFFCHDMAFFLQLDVPDFEIRLPQVNIFRTDEEKSERTEAPDESIDLSIVGSHMSPVKEFFAILNGYERIWTDRMHVGIAGAMLGRQVELVSSNYPKIAGVFEASIIKHYPTVRM